MWINFSEILITSVRKAAQVRQHFRSGGVRFLQKRFILLDKSYGSSSVGVRENSKKKNLSRW